MVEAVTDAFNQSGFNLGISTDSLGAYGIAGISFLAFVLVAGIGFYLWWRQKQNKEYNVRLRVYNEFNGVLVESKELLCKELNLRDGAKCIITKGTKELFPYPEYQSGYNVYCMLLLDNRRLKNFYVPSEFNGEKVTKIEYDKKDLDYQNLVLKDYERKLEKKMETFWDKHGKFIIFLVMLCIFSVALYFLLIEIINIIHSLGGVADGLAEVSRNQAELVKEYNIAKGKSPPVTITDGGNVSK